MVANGMMFNRYRVGPLIQNPFVRVLRGYWVFDPRVQTSSQRRVRVNSHNLARTTGMIDGVQSHSYTFNSPATNTTINRVDRVTDIDPIVTGTPMIGQAGQPRLIENEVVAIKL
jgi:hypothetical protein